PSSPTPDDDTCCFLLCAAVQDRRTLKRPARNLWISSPVVSCRSAERIMTQLDPKSEDARLQADPEVREGRATLAQIVLTVIGAIAIVVLVFYGLNHQRDETERTATAPATQTTGAAPPAGQQQANQQQGSQGQPGGGQAGQQGQQGGQPGQQPGQPGQQAGQSGQQGAQPGQTGKQGSNQGDSANQ